MCSDFQTDTEDSGQFKVERRNALQRTYSRLRDAFFAAIEQMDLLWCMRAKKVKFVTRSDATLSVCHCLLLACGRMRQRTSCCYAPDALFLVHTGAPAPEHLLFLEVCHACREYDFAEE